MSLIIHSCLKQVKVFYTFLQQVHSVAEIQDT